MAEKKPPQQQGDGAEGEGDHASLESQVSP